MIARLEAANVVLCRSPQLRCSSCLPANTAMNRVSSGHDVRARFVPHLKQDPLVRNKDDRAMFDEVFLPHMAEAYRLAQWLTGNAYDAEDVVQDAALRAFRGIKSFGAVNARAWSLTIVRNTAYSWLAKNKSKAVIFTDELTPAEQQELEHEGPQGTRIETPEEIVLFKADAEAVQKALAQLPAPFREVIVMREINQLNYRDIAEITNVPIGTVMSRLSRGRQLMIALLGDRK
jgi:RNA polymerase sigma factor (sigma-70 family)